MVDVQPQEVSQDDSRSVTVAALFTDGSSSSGEFVGNATILSRYLAVAPSTIFLSRLAASRARAIKEGPLSKAPAKTSAFPPMSLAFLRYHPTPGFYFLPVEVQIIDQELGFAVLSISGELPLPLSPDLLGDGEVPPPKTECEALFYDETSQVLTHVAGLVSNRSDDRFRLRLDPNAVTPRIGAAVLRGDQVVGMVTSVPPAAFESNSLSDPFPFVEVLGIRAMAESNAGPAVRNLLPWIKGDANSFTGFKRNESAQNPSSGSVRDSHPSGAANGGEASSEITDAELLARLGSPGSSGLRVLERAVGIRVQVRQGPVDTLHMEYLIAGLFDSLRGFFAAARIDGAELRRIIRLTVGTVIPGDYRTVPIDHLPPMSKHVREALLHALRYADEHAADKILSTHILYGALSVTDCRMIQVLNDRGILRENIREEDVLEDNGGAHDSSNTAKDGPASEELPENLRPMVPLRPIGINPLVGYSGPPMAANPTPKVASDLWAESDQLGYEAYARTIASLITHGETVPPLTIGIKAPWGAGKTSLMKRVQYLLDGDASLTERNDAGLTQMWQQSKMTFWYLLSTLNRKTIIVDPDKHESDDKPLAGRARKLMNEAVRVDALKPKASVAGQGYGISPRITVWFNAWKYQTSEQIWAGMAHCMISQITTRMDARQRELFLLRLHARRVNADEIRWRIWEAILRQIFPFVLLTVTVCVLLFGILVIAPVLIPALTASSKLFHYLERSIPFAGIVAVTWKTGSKLGEKAAGAVRDLVRDPDYEDKMGYLSHVESDMNDVLKLASVTSKQPLVVFVDDLDRCAPNKVAEVVEAINLFLCGDYPNCIFVLGMEPGMVAAALEVANKEVIEKALEMGLADSTVPVGWRFMEKIVQLPITIPPPAKGGKESYVKSLTGVYEANVGSVRMFPEVPSERQIPASQGNLAGALGMTGGVSISKVLRDVVRERELAVEPLNEAQVLKYISEMEGKTLGEVEEKSAKILAEVTQEKRRAAAEASKRVYARTFSERDPAMMEFVNEVAELVDWNPRQIKRYVNVFRFYSTLRHSLRVDGSLKEEEIPSDKVLAKFVALSIQWPHAVDCLRAKKDAKTGETNGRRTTVLELLELQSRKTVSEGETVDGVWEKYVGKDGLGLGAWAARRAFREFLSRGESLCEKEGHGLW